jgi:hypothetical protein
LSTTRGTVRTNVRTLIGDTNASNYAASSERMNRVIQNRMQALARLVGMPETAILTQANVQAGDDDYEFYIATVAAAPSAEYQQVLELRTVDANGALSPPVDRYTPDQVRAMRAYQTTTTGSDLAAYSVHNRTSSTATALNRTYITTYPARGSLALRIRVANIPARLSTDADAIPFNDSLSEVLEYDVAYHVIQQMRGSELARTLADSGALAGWKEAVELGVIGERRQSMMNQRAPGLVMVRR